MKKILIGSAVIATLALAGGAGANKGEKHKQTGATGSQVGGQQAQLDDNSKKFIREVAEDNMVELDLARLAVTKATDPQVKSFAQKMINDHQQVSSRLQSIAMSNDIMLPKTMPQKGADLRKEMQGLTGPDFDAKFVDVILEKHEGAIDKFVAFSEDVKNPELEVWVIDTLPKLMHHRMDAENLDQMLAGKTGMRDDMGKETGDDIEKSKDVGDEPVDPNVPMPRDDNY